MFGLKKHLSDHTSCRMYEEKEFTKQVYLQKERFDSMHSNLSDQLALTKPYTRGPVLSPRDSNINKIKPLAGNSLFSTKDISSVMAFPI